MNTIAERAKKYQPKPKVTYKRNNGKLGNLESYNAILISQGKNQKERMELLRQLAVQQLQTLER